ncbi:helix-turn-helix domain-containing protein [Kaistia sp. MMO-174]|uniref:helix-turn-helix domain-containing protein n=1 Tax=Kaistia sp. MMO-174 TaxID=3081256 RepID=UPI0030182BD6
MSAKSPNVEDVEIGARVRTLRMAAGLSQERLGEEIGVTFQQVQKYEKGTNRIGGSRLMQISRALRIPPGRLLADDGDPVTAAIARDAARLTIADTAVVRRFCDLPSGDRRRVEQLVDALHAANFQLEAAE